MKKVMVMVAMFFTLVCVASSTEAASKPWVLVEDTYVVQPKDTLNSIAVVFMSKNTYAQREIREFTEGIKELNPELDKREVISGETLHINYWIKAEK